MTRARYFNTLNKRKFLNTVAASDEASSLNFCFVLYCTVKTMARVQIQQKNVIVQNNTL